MHFHFDTLIFSLPYPLHVSSYTHDRNAAYKFARYWNDRYKLFGSDKFCAPMTLKGALKDDSLALSRGYVQLLPKTDTAGRAVCYIDWSSHEPSVGYTEDSMVRYINKYFHFWIYSD